MSDITYSYEFIQTIVRDSTYEENIPDLTKQRLSQLEKFVSGEHYTHAPVFARPTHSHHGNSHGHRGRGGGWQHSRGRGGYAPRKPKQVEDRPPSSAIIEQRRKKNEDDVHRHILSIRSYLNKLTDKTFTEMILNIQEELQNIAKLRNVEAFETIATHIFNIVAMNKFYSQLYAKLYKELIKTHAIFADILTKKYAEYLTVFMKCNYVDPKVDYDGFCAYNVETEKKQSIAGFVVHLMNMDLLEPSCVVSLMRVVIDVIYGSLDNKENKKVVDDMIEIIYHMMNVADRGLFADVERYDEIVVGRLATFSKYSPRMYIGITNKAVFRCRDIMDMIM
jgi:hypothetical protein